MLHGSLSVLNISDATLRNRWKTIRWRFDHAIAVSSESLHFISKTLWLYGPNVSEDAAVFVSISKLSFDAQNGSEKFQRDNIFGKMYAKFVLLIYMGLNIKVQAICILCPNALSPRALELSHTGDISSVTNFLKSCHQEFNMAKGHNSIAQLCQVGFRGVIMDLNYHKNVELTARWRYDKKADKIGVIFGILINRFNFSFKRESWDQLQGNYSGIYLNTGGDMPENYIYGRKLTLAYIISEFLLYCRKVPIISSTGWDFLWAPFDYVTWGFILATGILFSLYHRGQVSYGLDVFWGVLGVPYTSNWARSKLLACFLVVLLNMNVAYLSVITSRVIIPNREADIETPADLFRQGFRFIDSNVSSAGPGFIRYWGKYLEEARINTSVQSDVLVQVNSCGGTHDPECISKWASLATGVLYLHKKTEVLLSISLNMRDRCHGVRRPFRSYWVSFYSQGPLASIIYDTYQALIATGIDNFWERLQRASSIYDAYREANHTTNTQPPLNFDTPILVVFKAYGVLIAICIISFPIEQLYSIAKSRNNYDTKNMGNLFINQNLSSHLKLVVPNGRINNKKLRQPRVILVSNFGNIKTSSDKDNFMKPSLDVLW
ncbi:hypothetical protein Fcan01_05275 [Folsomia candida]|uniref:Uncharacterized protein n=2 Tax=Folsomia candida TaxID=158441 RepID=A0A226ESJ2_FOLCA|nr:hypothetical protein Fcan01_05275 [Folsomia candida]